MKTKTLNRKLTLNKKSIVDLNGEEMQKLKGGGLFTDDDPTCFWISCLCETHYKCCTGYPCQSLAH